MSRSDDFKSLAESARAMADLVDVQKDTVTWWTQFGSITRDLNEQLQAIFPTNERHIAAIKRGQQRDTSEAGNAS